MIDCHYMPSNPAYQKRAVQSMARYFSQFLSFFCFEFVNENDSEQNLLADTCALATVKKTIMCGVLFCIINIYVKMSHPAALKRN